MDNMTFVVREDLVFRCSICGRPTRAVARTSIGDVCGPCASGLLKGLKSAVHKAKIEAATWVICNGADDVCRGPALECEHAVKHREIGDYCMRNPCKCRRGRDVCCVPVVHDDRNEKANGGQHG